MAILIIIFLLYFICAIFIIFVNAKTCFYKCLYAWKCPKCLYSTRSSLFLLHIFVFEMRPTFIFSLAIFVWHFNFNHGHSFFSIICFSLSLSLWVCLHNSKFWQYASHAELKKKTDFLPTANRGIYFRLLFQQDRNRFVRWFNNTKLSTSLAWKWLLSWLQLRHMWVCYFALSKNNCTNKKRYENKTSVFGQNIYFILSIT